MNCPDVSVIIPVYNAEDYLTRCVDSILAQSLQSWELLLVDDGSTDGSGAVCDAYAKRDARIHVIHQKNGGISAARNAGLAVACGYYIGFVDADDWVEPEMFQALYDTAERSHSDIVMCDAVTVYPDGRTEQDTITQLPGSRTLKREDLTPQLLRGMAGSVCRCLYRTELLRRYDISFSQGIKFSEDRIFNILSFGFADEIVYCKRAYYDRYINMESTVHRFHADYFEAYLAAAKQTDEAIRRAWNNNEAYQKAYLSQLIGGAFAAVCNYYYKTSTFTGRQRRAAVEKICRDDTLHTAIMRAGDTSLRARLLLHRNVGALILYAKLANWKHRR